MSGTRIDGSSGGIGVVGGGQLAWMLAGAAGQEGVPLHVQTPSPDDPAVRLASSVVQAPLDDVAATRELARRAGVISFENEWLDLDALAVLEGEGVHFVPSLEALRPLVSKRSQRELLDRLHLPSPRWIPLEAVLAPAHDPPEDGTDPQGDRAPAVAAIAEPAGPSLPAGFAFPLMAKVSTGGYDGRGTRPIRDQAELEALLSAVDPAEWLLEELVPFEQELALVACRDLGGAVGCFPLVQTHQHQQVCDWVLAPAAVSQAVEARARNVAASLLTALDYAGVLSIEFFYGPTGLLINELAPRTHNSGHYTIEAARTSQFAQQVRIVRGQSLGDTSLRLPGALMVNLLGFESAGTADCGEKLCALAAVDGLSLHWYGKQASSPGRKLGHVTVALTAADPTERAAEARRRLAEIRAIWPLPPAQTP